jgi:uncharacterized delta-60 repeat protein
MKRRIFLSLLALMLLGLIVVLWRAPRPATPESPVALPTAAAPAAQLAPAAAPADPAPVTVEPADYFAQFQQWAAEYGRADATGRAALLQAGVELARARRAELLRLIQTDPERALHQAVPYDVRRRLPAEIQRELEQPVSAAGTLTTTFRCDPEHKHPGPHPPPERTFRTADHLYSAYVYGWREQHITRSQLVLHGIALDDAAGASHLAVHPDPARVLSAAEAADLLAAPDAPPRPPAHCQYCGTSLTPADTVLLDLGPGLPGASDSARLTAVCPSHADSLNAALRQGQLLAHHSLRAIHELFAQNTGPEWDQLKQLVQFNQLPQYFGSAANSSTVPTLPPPVGGVRLGQRRLLLIPAQYADEAAPVATRQAAENAGRLVNERFDRFSYGFEQFITTVTPPVVLPHRLWFYDEAGDGTIISHAIARAVQLGYTSGTYDHIYVIISSIPSAKFGGISSGLVFGAGAGTLVHEIGHNTGLGHANFFDNSRPPNPTQPNPPLPFDTDSLVGHPDINGPFINALSSPVSGGNGSILEYGDTWDTMGSGGSDFGAPMKIALGWLPRQAWRTVTQGETNRIYAFDQGGLTNGRLYALQVHRRNANPAHANSGVLTISHRRAITDNSRLQNGILLQHGSGTTLLLDTSPGTPQERADSAIPIGRTFTDPEARLHITPLARGGTGPNAWVDVVIHPGDTPGNRAPQISSLTAAALSTNGTVLTSDTYLELPVGATVTFAAQATDADGDLLSWHFEYSDGVFDWGGSTVTRTFTTAGNYVLRAEASDMKGGVDSTHVLVRIGNPTTRNIRGRVVDPNGLGVANVRVHNGISPITAAAYRYGITDARGYFTIPNLAAGSYEVSGFAYRWRTTPLNYNNGTIVVGGADVTGIQLLATPLTRVSVGVDADALESGTPGSFRITRTGPTNEPLVVRLSTSTPDGAGFSASASTSVTIPAGATFTNVTITPVNNAVGDGGRTVVLTLALQTNYTRVEPLLTNNTIIFLTNNVPVPGWERRPRLTDGAQTWFQTDPNYVLGVAEASMRIVDDDPPSRPAVSLTRVNPGVVEGSRNASGFVLTRGGALLNSNLTVQLTWSGTATNGVDYLPMPGSVTIPAGRAELVLPVVPINNAFVDANRTVTATVVAAPDYTVSGSAQTITIVDDDRPNVAVYASDPRAGRGGNNGQFTFVRTGDLTDALEIKYLLGGTAIPGVDYQPLSGTLALGAGQSSATLNLVPLPSPSSPGTKTAVLILADTATYNPIGDGRATVRIADVVPTVNVTASAATAEGGAAGGFTFTRTGSTTAPLTVFFRVGGTANPNTDYAAIGTNVVIPAGSASVTLPITPVNDPFREFTATGQNNARLNEHEYVEIALVETDTYEVGNNAEARVTLTDDDGSAFPMVGFMLPASEVREDAGTVQIPVRIAGNPTNSPNLPILINWAVTGGTAVRGTNWSGGLSGQLQFISNRVDTAGFYNRTFQNQTLSFSVLNDGVQTEDRTLILTLDYFTGFITNTNGVISAYPTNAFIGDYRTHTVTIRDVNRATVSITAVTTLGYENGVQPAVFRLSHNGNTATPVTVNLFVDGTAVPDADYVALPTQVTIPAGTNAVLVPVVPIDDTVEEPAETVRVTIAQTPGVRGQGGSATLVIVSDDGPIQFTSVDFAAVENSGAAQVRVIRTGAINEYATVDYVFTDVTALNGVDYLGTNGTLEFFPGEAVKIITVPLVDDVEVEGDETLRLSLVNPIGGAPLGGQGTTTLVIRDDDVGLQFSAAGFAANENAGAAAVEVTRSGLVNLPVSVDLSTANGSATAGSDYLGVTTNLTFLPGETTKTVLIPLLNDTQLESDETVLLSLSNPAGLGAVLGALSNAVLTIVEDEARIEFSAGQFEVAEFAGFAPVQVRRLGGTVHPLTVSFRALNGTASNALDFVQAPGTVTFAGNENRALTDGSGQVVFVPGQSLQTIFVPIINDVIGEGHEQFSLVLTNITGPGGLPAGTFALGTQTNTTVTILDDELPGSVDFAYAPVLGAGGAGGPTTTVQGTVRNSVNGQGLPGVTVSIGGIATLSGAGGAYTLSSVPVGPAQLQATLTGFSSFTNALTLLNQPVNTFDFVMSPGITSADTVRLVLTWGQNPADLDSYLDTPPISGQTYQISFFNRGNLLAPPFALLDVDDVDGFGPETITITNLFSGTYVYAVNRFSGLGTIAGSGAKVEVYTDAGLVERVTAPATGTGDWWQVLQIDGDSRAITVINQIGTQPPGIVSNVPPTISRAPVSQAVPLGGTTVFSVQAGGSAPLSYQWEFNGSPLSGQTNATLVLTNVGLAQAGNYRVNVSNPYGNTNSPVAVLTVGALTQPCGSGITGGLVFALAVDTGLAASNAQLAGSIVVGGSFRSVNGLVANRIARLTPQGLLDASFNPGTGANSNVFALAMQADGKVLLGGEFTTVGGVGRARVARLLSNGALDTSFDPGAGANGPVQVIAVQPDGKVLVGGDFTSFAGQTSRAYLVRLEADGTLDATFAPVLNGPVQALAVRSDGGIYVGGCFISAGGTARGRIALLTTNGTLDTSFNPGAGFNGVVRTLALQSDGRLVVGGAFDTFQFNPVGFLVRLQPNGQRDTSFAVGAGANGPVNAVAVAPGDKIYVTGAFDLFDGLPRAGYVRLRPDGALDPLFDIGTGANGPVFAAVAQPNSALVIGGDFTACNGIPRTGLARIHGDESSNISVFDLASTTFSVLENAGPAVITVVRSGNTNAAGAIVLSTTNGTAVAGVHYAAVVTNVSFAPGVTVRTVNVPILNNALADGDRTVLLSLSGATPTRQIGVNSNAVLTIVDDEQGLRLSAPSYGVQEGSNLVVRVLRQGAPTGTVSVWLNTADGTAQNGADYLGLTNLLTFPPGVTEQSVVIPTFADGLPESPETVSLALSAPAGAVLLTPFSATVTISDFLFTPGTLDTNFNPGTGANNFVRAVAFQSDGKLFVGGAFTQINGTNRNFLARLHANGALDLGFAPGTGPDAAVSTLAAGADGRVFLGGAFTNVNGTRFNRVALLNTNGGTVAGFSSPFTLDAALNALTLRGDGRVLLGGFFSQPTIGVTRLAPDGTVDPGFAPAPGLNGPIHAVAPDSAGGVFVGGGFTTIGGFALPRLARLGADGAVDPGFVPAPITGGVVYALALQTDGKLVLGGSFTAVDGTNRAGVARLNTDGSLDLSFDPGLGANATVFSLAVQSNGKIVLGGAFTGFAGAPAGRYVRLLADGSRDLGFDSSVGADGVVYSVAVHRGRIALGGAFTTVNGLPRGGVALLRADPPAPRFTSVAPLPAPLVTELESEPGVTYVIEATEDLTAAPVIWTPISTNTASGVTLPVMDPDAALYPERFYRARVLEQ